MGLKRKIYKELIKWKEESQGESALLIKGARRVGKSYICEEFGRNEYRSMIFIDFTKVTNEILDIFINESYDLDLFFVKLSAYYNAQLHHRESLIVFDEVQAFPFARQLIKHLVADGRYDYIETGSLLSIKKNIQNILIPSEEDQIEMFPLDFEEFLWALGEETTMPYITTCFEGLIPLGAALHRKALNLFRQYMLVGGMPQAVIAYLDEKDFRKADLAKRRILNLYREDISKFAKGYESKVKAIFDSIPGQLSRKEKRYKLSSLKKEARFRTYEDSFMWLADAMIINPCFNATDPNIGLALSADHRTQKIYMHDTGLLVTHSFQVNKVSNQSLYRSLLFDKLSVNEGMFMENVVAQMFRASGHRLYFYSRSDASNRVNHMEIDFLIARENKMVPVEVKSSSYRKHSSLDKFRSKFKNRIGDSFILYGKDVMIKDEVIHLPIYMAPLL